MTTATSPTLPAAHAGRRLGVAGVVIAALGLAAYVVQIASQRLFMPWYMPMMATIGVALIVASFWQRSTVWRGLALVVVLLLTGAEWTMLLATRLPPYTGPVAVGQAFPTFATKRADGKLFTQADLLGDQTNVLVFFRGRW
jgi:4-amino-4-deoxy-L-arabinose transferase-like glycosyltransferase